MNDAERLLNTVGKTPAAEVLWTQFYLRTGQISSAIKSITSSIALNDQNPEPFIWLSVAYRMSRQLERAEDAARMAVHLAPDRPQSYSALGQAYLLQEKGVQAVEAFEKAASLQPSNPEYLHNLGLAYVTLGQDTQAAEFFKSAVALSDVAFPSYLALGELMVKYGNPGGALEAAKKVLAGNPKNLKAHMLAARALSNLGEDVTAEDHIKAALQIDPMNSEVLSMLGFRLQFLGRFSEAEEQFRKSLISNPIQGASYWGLRQSNRAHPGELLEAEKLCAMAREKGLAPLEKAYLHFTVAKSFADNGEYEKAMASYDLANQQAARAQFAGKKFDQRSYEEGLGLTQRLFTKEFIEANKRLANPSDKPIFIIGMMRSGTTLMEQIISSHPQVSSGGELRFWLARGPKVVDPNTPAIQSEGARELQSDYLELLSRLSDRAHVTDKMPENAQLLGLIYILFPNARVLHMRRHPVDVALSIYTTPYSLSPSFAHVRENIVFAIQKHEELMAHWRQVLPRESFLDVSYEDLVGDSQVMIRKVLDYCGLSWDEACLRPDENERTVYTPSVWQARQPIYTSSTERWRSYEPYLGAFASLLPSQKVQ